MMYLADRTAWVMSGNPIPTFNEYYNIMTGQGMPQRIKPQSEIDRTIALMNRIKQTEWK